MHCHTQQAVFRSGLMLYEKSMQTKSYAFGREMLLTKIPVMEEL